MDGGSWPRAKVCQMSSQTGAKVLRTSPKKGTSWHWRSQGKSHRAEAEGRRGGGENRSLPTAVSLFHSPFK